MHHKKNETYKNYASHLFLDEVEIWAGEITLVYRDPVSLNAVGII